MPELRSCDLTRRVFVRLEQVEDCFDTSTHWSDALSFTLSTSESQFAGRHGQYREDAGFR
ncbi:hypothetical protein AGR2A_Lc40021 [Agrobacterium genomosp. 2 str. CFBP 5494]|uniref:Uncharacterized protein n=1 Tax=Agrobacterium genomosp. 2 str. CFBP 5494 TaxID=1183436 RepID=A0A9W5B4G7_9HYPH|nr:hypothetical protein AGR2A_Lc40021 [Agrobacterium genomosp. 2 str. CFBP 5494]